VNIWTLFFAGLGLAMVIEGMPYFIAPRGMRRFLELIKGMSDGALRASGLALIATGLLVTWLATR
jgi:uncharacterized protein YjeT (DUF2065 family)